MNLDLEKIFHTLEAREKKIKSFFIPSDQTVSPSNIAEAIKNAKRILKESQDARALLQIESQIEQEQDALRRSERELEKLKFTKL